MSNTLGTTHVCSACGETKDASLFSKWRTKCKACKSLENSKRLKERYATDPEFARAAKERVADWQRKNAERSNEYHRRRHAAKVAKGDKTYLSQQAAAHAKYARSEKGRAAAMARTKRYEASGQAKIWRQERRQKPSSRTSQLLTSTRNRALKLNVAFDLIFDDVYPAIAAGVCVKTGLPFDLSVHPDHRTHPFAPSLDRIDPAGGYVKSNVQIVCWAYNAARNQWGDDVLLRLARAIVDADAKTGV